MCLPDQRNTCRASRVRWHLSLTWSTMALVPGLQISGILSAAVSVMLTSGLSDLLAHQPTERPQVQSSSQLCPLLLCCFLLINHLGLSESFLALTHSPLKNLPPIQSLIFICQRLSNQGSLAPSFYGWQLLIYPPFANPDSLGKSVTETGTGTRNGVQILSSPAAAGKHSSWKCILHGNAFSPFHTKPSITSTGWSPP